jgi:hypothetical protein
MCAPVLPVDTFALLPLGFEPYSHFLVPELPLSP